MSFINRYPEVDEDLIDIWLRIAGDNPAAADKVLDTIQMCFENIASQPQIGAPYPTRNPKLKGILYFPVSAYPDYLVFYLPIKNGIDLVRVLHRARNLVKLI